MTSVIDSLISDGNTLEESKVSVVKTFRVLDPVIFIVIKKKELDKLEVKNLLTSKLSEEEEEKLFPMYKGITEIIIEKKMYTEQIG